jgi:ribosome-associated protein
MDGSDNLEVNDALVVPAAELVWRFSPSGGPGGQHANTSNTRAEVVFDIASSGVLTAAQREALTERFGSRVAVAVDDTRSQTRNRQLALERLAARLAETLQPRRSRRATKPSRGAKERRLKDKRQHAQRKAERRRRYDAHD